MGSFLFLVRQCNGSSACDKLLAKMDKVRLSVQMCENFVAFGWQ